VLILWQSLPPSPHMTIVSNQPNTSCQGQSATLTLQTPSKPTDPSSENPDRASAAHNFDPSPKHTQNNPHD
jgi:hypothetical protein